MARNVETDIRRGKKIVHREADEVFTTVQALTERLLESYQDYESRNILKLDEFELFFKALWEKGLMENGKKTKGGKKSKQRMNVMFIVDGSFVFESTFT